jgi:hypothetical protein
MKKLAHKTAMFADVIAAYFDKKGRYSVNPRQVTRLATRAVVHLIDSVRELSVSPPDGERLHPAMIPIASHFRMKRSV